MIQYPWIWYPSHSDRRGRHTRQLFFFGILTILTIRKLLLTHFSNLRKYLRRAIMRWLLYSIIESNQTCICGLSVFSVLGRSHQFDTARARRRHFCRFHVYLIRKCRFPEDNPHCRWFLLYEWSDDIPLNCNQLYAEIMCRVIKIVADCYLCVLIWYARSWLW